MGSTNIRFMDYKPRSLDDTDSIMTENEPIENRMHSVSEFM
jgi:hypothetical protein